MPMTCSNPDSQRSLCGFEDIREKELEARRFWDGYGRVMASVTPPGLRAGLQKVSLPVRIGAHLRDLPKLQSLPGCNIPSVYPDFGTISHARYFGCHDVSGPQIDRPHVEPVARSLEEAMDLQPADVDAPNLDAAEALRLHQAVCDHFQTRDIWLRTPDAQGALNTAAMVMDQTELLMATVSDQQRLSTWLGQITDWMVQMWRYLRDSVDGRVCGSIWPHTFLPADLGVSLTEDMMPLMSPQTYQQFGIPTLRQIDQAFNGLHIHCCGHWGHHAPTLAESGLTIRAVEFHYPYTCLEELDALADSVVFVPLFHAHQQNRYQSYEEYLLSLLDLRPTRRFWFVLRGEDQTTFHLADQLLQHA